MPQYFQSSPWQDAARYGQGLADTLGQAFIQMPQQRAMLAMQQHKAQQDAQQQAYQNQQQVLQQQQLGTYRQHQMSNQDAQLSEMKQYHQGEVQYRQQQADAAMERAGRPVPDEWTPNWETGTAFNKRTGEFKSMGQPQGGPGLGQGPGMSKINPTAAMNAVSPIIAAGLNNPAMQNPTNAAYPMWNQATNTFAQMNQAVAPMPGRGGPLASPQATNAAPGRRFRFENGQLIPIQ